VLVLPPRVSVAELVASVSNQLSLQGDVSDISVEAESIDGAAFITSLMSQTLPDPLQLSKRSELVVYVNGAISAISHTLNALLPARSGLPPDPMSHAKSHSSSSSSSVGSASQIQLHGQNHYDNLDASYELTATVGETASALPLKPPKPSHLHHGGVSRISASNDRTNVSDRLGYDLIEAPTNSPYKQALGLRSGLRMIFLAMTPSNCVLKASSSALLSSFHPFRQEPIPPHPLHPQSQGNNSTW